MAQIRFAELTDLEDIVQLAIKAMDDDLMEDFLYPNRHEFPIDHYNDIKARYKQFLDPNNDDWRILVIELEKQIIAVSVWFYSTTGRQYQPLNHMQKDIDQARMKAFQDGIAASEMYFAKYCGWTIRLHTLGTHPDYRRKGYAKSLCQWGIDRAECYGLVVQVVASEMGRDLYLRLKFTILGEIPRQVPGEEKKLISYAMAFNPENQPPSKMA